MLTTVRDDSYDFAILAYSLLGDIMLQVHLSFARNVHNVERKHCHPNYDLATW